jgi:hypothetical protein
MLQQEIEKRTGIRLQVAETQAPGVTTTIVVGTSALLPAPFALPAGVVVPDKKDGYAVQLDGSTLYLIGHDDRGAMFAAGCLIREADLAKGTFNVPSDINVSTAPVYPMRGHQIGYRDTANSYDAWDLATYEQYVRDCILFGGNSVELIPALEENVKDGKVMQKTQHEMNVALSGMLHSYGVDVWFWLALDEDVTKPEEYQLALEKRDALFASYPAIDHIMVPGGDPGDTEPAVLMPWLKDMATVLRKHFPEAGVWVSNQGFTDEHNEEFFKYLRDQQPDWFTGVVFGPWTKMSFKEVRERTPERYPIRRYPDITHNVRCQYPVPEWDPAFAQTIARECSNPRPIATAHIHNLFAPMAQGFVSYSDGCHDDLNKMIWSSLAWDPNASVEGIVRDYARAFFGEAYADDIAKGLFMLESNWVGQASENASIDATLAHWQAIEQRAGADLAGNWRFQLYLLRAICDAHIRARSIVEKQEEQEICATLAAIHGAGAGDAAAAVLKTLSEKQPAQVRADLRTRIDELALAMHKSIGMQYSVDEPYLAANPERGAILDGIDLPLNNRLWFIKQLEALSKMNSDEEKEAHIQRIATWESPKEGSLYDDLGCGWKQPHLVRQTTWKEDPGFVRGPQEEHSRGQDNGTRLFTSDRLSWLNQAQTLFGTPIKLHYDGLDSTKTYTLRVTYAGRFNATMRLIADSTHVVHGPLGHSDPIWPVDFKLPQEVTKDGVLDLEWQLVDGRGCQVAEVWLIPE